MFRRLSVAGILGSSLLLGGIFSQSAVPTASLRTPLDFGAVGDGIANDTEAMQRAIDATQNGGALYFPGGCKFLVRGLTATGEIHWLGPGGSWLSDRAPNGAVLVLGDNADGDLLTLDHAVDSSLSGIGFDGNKAHQTQPRNGIRMINCEFTRLQNVYVTSCSGSGIAFENHNTVQTSDEVDLIDCYSVLNVLDGIRFGFVAPGIGSPGDCEIIGGHYDYNGGDGIDVHVSAYSSVIGANVLSNGQAGIEATYSTGLNITSNMVRNNMRQGVALGKSAQYTECTNCSVSGNQIQLNSREGPGRFSELDVGFGTSNTRIIGNYCGDIHAGSSMTANVEHGIWLHDGATHTVLVGNTCPSEDAVGGAFASESGSTYTAVANMGIPDSRSSPDVPRSLHYATNGGEIVRLAEVGRETLWLGLTGARGGRVVLPAPAHVVAGATVVVKDEGGGAGRAVIAVMGNGVRIDGGSAVSVDRNYGSLRLRFDGSQWWTW